MEPEDVEDFEVLDDLKSLPTYVLEEIYYQVWAELMERGMDFDEITRH